MLAPNCGYVRPRPSVPVVLGAGWLAAGSRPRCFRPAGLCAFTCCALACRRCPRPAIPGPSLFGWSRVASFSCQPAALWPLLAGVLTRAGAAGGRAAAPACAVVMHVNHTLFIRCVHATCKALFSTIFQAGKPLPASRLGGLPASRHRATAPAPRPGQPGFPAASPQPLAPASRQAAYVGLVARLAALRRTPGRQVSLAYGCKAWPACSRASSAWPPPAGTACAAGSGCAASLAASVLRRAALILARTSGRRRPARWFVRCCGVGRRPLPARLSAARYSGERGGGVRPFSVALILARVSADRGPFHGAGRPVMRWRIFSLYSAVTCTPRRDGGRSAFGLTLNLSCVASSQHCSLSRST